MAPSPCMSRGAIARQAARRRLETPGSRGALAVSFGDRQARPGMLAPVDARVGIRAATVSLSIVAAGGLVACGSTGKSASTANRNATGVRASYYEYFQDERTGNAHAACALSTKSDQARIAADTKASS